MGDDDEQRQQDQPTAKEAEIVLEGHSPSGAGAAEGAYLHDVRSGSTQNADEKNDSRLRDFCTLEPACKVHVLLNEL